MLMPPPAISSVVRRLASNIQHLASSIYKAGNGTRTRDPNLGKVVLYQLSYSRDEAWWRTPRHSTTSEPARVHAGSPPERGRPTMEARGIEPLTS